MSQTPTLYLPAGSYDILQQRAVVQSVSLLSTVSRTVAAIAACACPLVGVCQGEEQRRPFSSSHILSRPFPALHEAYVVARLQACAACPFCPGIEAIASLHAGWQARSFDATPLSNVISNIRRPCSVWGLLTARIPGRLQCPKVPNSLHAFSHTQLCCTPLGRIYLCIAFKGTSCARHRPESRQEYLLGITAVSYHEGA